jgi:hypothetical protein
MLDDREWRKVGGAAPDAIAKLRVISPAALPESYLALLSWSNGGEGPLPVQPYWFVLYPAEETIQIEEEDTFKDFFPGLFVIGGNGGGEAVALDMRASGALAVVAFDMTNIHLDESVLPIAPTFDAMLDLIGKD